ncbi:dual adapter for phosphotyrosine and 3-phosphotyrosine and 3-phosphoinositide-like [Arapaima gigas]
MGDDSPLDSAESTKLQAADELETLGWYHGDLSRHAAEALLMSNGGSGSYLLRDSQEGPNSFALSVRAKDSVKHFQVSRRSNRYSFGFKDFHSLREFIQHFANQPLIGSETGCLIIMDSPYPRVVEEPCIYEPVRVHTAMQTGRTEKDLVANAPSLGTKEGYLVKQGAVVKSWKTRWFTLNRNELKYFKDKTVTNRCDRGPSTNPMEWWVTCSSVPDSIVFPGRTFYLCAHTGGEADEWMAILRWKLVRSTLTSVTGFSTQLKKNNFQKSSRNIVNEAKVF